MIHMRCFGSNFIRFTIIKSVCYVIKRMELNTVILPLLLFMTADAKVISIFVVVVVVVDRCDVLSRICDRVNEYTVTRMIYDVIIC